LYHFLKKIQADVDCSFNAANNDIVTNYNFFRTSRKIAEGHTHADGLENDIQNTINRWRNFERAEGRNPKFSMIDHYSNAHDLMPVTWMYSYVQ